MAELHDRLRALMEEAGEDQADLASAIGVTQGTISLILLGRTQRSRFLPDIAGHYGVSLGWLVGKEDDRVADNGPPKLSRDEVVWVGYWRALDRERRAAVVQVVQYLVHDTSVAHPQRALAGSRG